MDDLDLWELYIIRKRLVTEFELGSIGKKHNEVFKNLGENRIFYDHARHLVDFVFRRFYLKDGWIRSRNA